MEKTFHRTAGVRRRFEVWWRLIHRRALRRVARAVRLIWLVSSAPRITDLAKFPATIRKWDDHRRSLSKGFCESSDTVKVGIMLHRCPRSRPSTSYCRPLVAK